MRTRFTILLVFAMVFVLAVPASGEQPDRNTFVFDSVWELYNPCTGEEIILEGTSVLREVSRPGERVITTEEDRRDRLIKNDSALPYHSLVSLSSNRRRAYFIRAKHP
jgi:hypothetical protein